ncbi:carboxymuconolactone decarboxylase family protein [Cohnella sp. GCM10027633]|uniref:carboxymuconolactone decarboxylase family protein n=1 Tax=unclassified Cohnella TaxID=2636738 RepID=UPI00362CD69A
MSSMERMDGLQEEEADVLSSWLPNVADAYEQFANQCFAAGELDAKTKQLIALGVSIFAGNEMSMNYHAQEAISQGASERQIIEAASVVAAAAGGHALSHGAVQVEEALELLRGSGSLVSAVEPDLLHSRMQDYLQDTEFAEESGYSDWDGMEIPGGTALSPSY